MHVLFVHKNFPAQFGHIARHLIQRRGYECSFVSEAPAGNTAGIRRLQYKTRGGARSTNHYCSRTFENQMWASHAVLEALAAQKELRPDLIVGHSGYASTLFLRELYGCPIINYFEYFYAAKDSDMDFRADLPPCTELDRLRARARNAVLLLDLTNCDAGYSPTNWQRSRLPQAFQHKLVTIFDGVETDLWRRDADGGAAIHGLDLPPEARVVTYVSRGLEAMRGFDVFMKTAKRLCDERRDCVFLVIGEDRVAYGGDLRFTEGKTFKQWVLSQDDYDLTRIRFLGRVRPTTLAGILSRSDLHIYLTAPFVLSWSLMDALACGATVLASSTPPVQEMIQHQKNGLLCDFFDVDGLVQQANQVLDDPRAFEPLGAAGVEMIRDRYSLDVCLPQLAEFFENTSS